MARAKQDLLGVGFHGKVLPILLHGDAAFAGQGVVAETLQLSELHGYRVGGTIHIVVNNQIGFTTAPKFGRSTTYATDIAKMIQAPIFHVNGDDPEACVRVMHLAFEYRQEFDMDIVIDLVCYRRHGHNEGDEPAFTQPLMYSKIEERRSVRKLYLEIAAEPRRADGRRGRAVVRGLPQASAERVRGNEGALLRKRSRPRSRRRARASFPTSRPASTRSRLELIHKAMTTFPEGFEPHPKLKRQIEKRQEMLEQDAVDWAAGEAFAFGSLLLEGFSGAAVGPGLAPWDVQSASLASSSITGPKRSTCRCSTSARTRPRSVPRQHPVGVRRSWASSTATRSPTVTLWSRGKAQFGDFVNGAQVVVDQFIVAGEDKWKQASGLVLLLPHGYEGQGPEHSSARLERFLTLSAEDNIQVVQPTTAAQYFHLLRARCSARSASR